MHNREMLLESVGGGQRDPTHPFLELGAPAHPSPVTESNQEGLAPRPQCLNIIFALVLFDPTSSIMITTC